MGHAPQPESAPAPVAAHKPYVAAEQIIPEFTVKAVVFGSLFGILFGASTVYLALKAGLTVSASIPIAVLSISVLRYFGRPTILENNIVQTIGSAGESVAAGVAFTVPALLFLSDASHGADYFNYVQIMMLAATGGILGVLFMVPLRRSLIVAEHGNLPYPEGAACADVLIAGEKGGRMAGLVFGGVAVAAVYKALNSIFSFWKEAVTFQTSATAKLPNAVVSNEISPEFLGVGYILGPRIGGIMVSGSVIAWLVLIPLLTVLALPDAKIDAQLLSLGFDPGTIDAWRATNDPERYYRGYVRLIGAGAVTMAGIITLIRTMPSIVKSLRGSISAVGAGSGSSTLRTERDIPMSVVILGSLALVGVLTVLPILPGTVGGKLLMAVLMLVFGFLFVTVSSRIVGIIGSSSNPISAMTIATLLGTCAVFLAMGLGGDANQPIALCVGAIVCIAAANAGATSQDLKTGYLVGATPIRQQIGLVIGVLVSTLVIGFTLKFLHNAYAAEGGIGGTKFPAPQATLMATIIKGVMSQNLDWSFLLVGAGLSVTVFLCGVSPLAWAVGVYLPIGTTFPIFIGGLLRWLCDKLRGAKEESDISPGMLFATGLVAGGTLTGVFSALLRAIPNGDSDVLTTCQHVGESFQATVAKSLDLNLYSLIFYAAMGFVLVKVATKKPSAA
ncbi:MAG: oligopeptide transporter, OPT family [Planctomycetes bacterium]|nr:oligopeptide transporter, OPT family [Planctomycetota bacterium]